MITPRGLLFLLFILILKFTHGEGKYNPMFGVFQLVGDSGDLAYRDYMTSMGYNKTFLRNMFADRGESAFRYSLKYKKFYMELTQNNATHYTMNETLGNHSVSSVFELGKETEVRLTDNRTCTSVFTISNAKLVRKLECPDTETIPGNTAVYTAEYFLRGMTLTRTTNDGTSVKQKFRRAPEKLPKLQIGFWNSLPLPPKTPKPLKKG